MYIFVSPKNSRNKTIIKENLNLNQKITYDEMGEKIFTQNKTLSFDKLDELYFGIKLNYSKYDNIHILFAFNNEYHLLASVTITTILKNANKNTYIHIHIIAADGFLYQTMKKLNTLKKKINKNVEFIFYDGIKAEIDFGSQIREELFGVGEYAKLLGPVLVDKSIDRIITLDAGDLLVEKDLLELYNYPLEDYLIRGVPDPYSPCNPGWNIFFIKEGYLNAGVYLYNLKKWREMDIYNDIINFYQNLNYTGKLVTPHQDIINCFLPSSAIGKIPTKFNLHEIIHLNENDDEQIGAKIYKDKCSYFYGKKDEIIEAEKNIVIRHYTKTKVYNGEGDSELIEEWKKYAKMTGFYEEISELYPFHAYSNIFSLL